MSHGCAGPRAGRGGPWVVALALVGCGDDGGSGPSDGGSTAAPGSTSAASTDATGSGGPVTTAADTTAGSGGLLTGGLTTGGAATGDSGGLPMGDHCEVAADCVLDDDCCHCSVHAGEIPEPHGCAVASCDQTACAENGLLDPAPLCLAGNCLLPKVSCDPSTVVCDLPPPACDAGQAAQIVDGCYTQACIPLSSCEQVAYFSCDECDTGEVCVRFSACGGDSCTSSLACLPDPGAAVINCATAGDALCGWFGAGYDCYDEPAGPYCCGGDPGPCADAG